MTVDLYDPLTYENLMMGLVVSFEKQETQPLNNEVVQDIQGPGIYSLHYTGELDFYMPIKGAPNAPVYVGKAVPPGSRKGDTIDTSKPVLRRRINEHLKSIDKVVNLDRSQFSFRSLAVVPVWITLAERFLMDHYTPVWNRCIDGFGDHDPGSGRYQGEKSWWDTLHPGRPWADRLQTVKTRESAITMVNEFFGRQATP